jgi:MFS family permease
MKMHDKNIPGSLPPHDGSASPKLFHAGTLTYTVAGLGALFFWLLWGDFCFTIMEVVWNSIVPLKIKELGAPNWVIGAIMVSIPQILNTVLNPVISTASDRFRSRWGRRRPFMMVATPFIGGLLCVVGFSPDIGKWLFAAGLGQATGWSQGMITVGVIAVTIGLFRIAELFISTLFYYFFNDVVPQKVIARFLALFRVVGAGAGALYNVFVYQHALTHMRVIFVAAGLLYFVGFMMMCWRVKEGEYPPPTPRPDKGKSVLAVVKMYAKDCLRQRLYILLYLHIMLWTLAGAAGVFTVFLNLSLGMTLKQLGTIAAAVGVASALLTYPAGMLADRFHPMRLMIWMKFGMVIVVPLNFIWLFTHYTPSVNFWILVVLNVINLPLNLIYGALLMPLYMRLYPREQFGQFCSFMAICTASVGIVSGLVGGFYIDWIRKVFPDALYGTDFCYRLIPAWTLFFVSLSLILLALLYKEWRRLGGEAYTPHGVSAIHPDKVPNP